MLPNKENIKLAAQSIKNADALIFTAGAGMGVDSSLPDFRGDKGFWNAYPPYAKKGLRFTDMANPQWFNNDPEFAWGFYGHRLNLYRDTSPHEGFKILLKWGESKPKKYFVFTSNVDGQFQKAGFDPERIEEVHGSIHRMQCINNCGQKIFPADPYSFKIDKSTMRAASTLPVCPACGAVARPNILMFGDWGYDGSRQKLQTQRFQGWLKGLNNSKVTIIECGAGSAVPTVRMASEQLAGYLQAKLIRINIREGDVPGGQISLPIPALEAIKKIDET